MQLHGSLRGWTEVSKGRAPGNSHRSYSCHCVCFVEGRSVRSGAMRTSHPKTRTRRAPNSSRTSCDTSCPSLKTPSQVPHPVSPGPLPGPSCHGAHSPYSSTFGNAGKNQERKTIRGDLRSLFQMRLATRQCMSRTLSAPASNFPESLFPLRHYLLELNRASNIRFI